MVAAMITLHGFSPAYGLPDLSPFVLKAATYFRMAGIPYRSVSGDPRKAPKGKLPFIEDDGQKVADSSFIVDHCRRKHKDLDAGLGAHEKAVGRAVQSMLESDFYFVMVTLRWIDDRGWAVMGPTLQGFMKQGGVPGFLSGVVAGQVRKQVAKAAHAQGTGRHSYAEVEAMGVGHWDSVAELLGDKSYFFGDAPRSIDATIFGFLWPMLDAPFEGPIKEAIKAHKNLVAYRDRMRDAYWKS